MTSNSSSTNLAMKRSDKKKEHKNRNRKKGTNRQGNFLLHDLRSYWWIAVICSVVYGFAGPVFTMLRLDSMNVLSRPSDFATEEAFSMRQMEQLAAWFRAEGFMPLYFSAIVLAACIGCVMFFYLQKKNQVNFYHSQPITRTRLFVNQYVTGLILNIAPLAVMTVLTFAVVAAYGLGSIVDWGVVAQHFLYISLFALASYSIAVFAGQLAGTMAIQMVMNAVLHFCVPIAAVLTALLCQLFFATYNSSFAWLESSLNFSPICAAFIYLSGSPYKTGLTIMGTEPMAGVMLATQLGLIVVFTVLSWVLYQKRPSEATGKSLVYPITELMVKAYMMFVIAITAGLVFQSVASNVYFYFAVVAFAILTHMTCEVIIQHDFKAMAKRFHHCAAIVVLILAVVGVFRFDVLGYDSWLPEPEDVQQVSLYIPGAENRNYSTEYYFTQNPEVKQGVYNLLQPIVEETCYQSSDFERNDDYGIIGDNTSIHVDYVLNNGDVKSRIYRGVPEEMIEEPYEALYNQLSFREALYQSFMKATPDSIDRMSINNTLIYDKDWYTDQTVVDDVIVKQDGEIAVMTAVPQEVADATDRYPNQNNDYQDQSNGYQVMVKILEAYQLDVRDRQFDTLKTAYPYCIEIMLPDPNSSNSSQFFDAPVYRSDKRTMALLEQMDIDDNSGRSYSDALIFRGASSSEDEMRQVLDVAYSKMEVRDKIGADNLTVEQCIELVSEEAELVGHISGVANVDLFIKETGLLDNSGIFAEIDDSHFVLLRYNNSQYNDWNTQLFYEGTVPEQYQ